MDLDTIHILAVGVAFLAGFVSVIYTIPKVDPWWRPVYWLAVPMVAILAFLYWEVGVSRVLGVRPFFPRATGILLRLGLALVALEVIVVPYVHRREKRMLRDG